MNPVSFLTVVALALTTGLAACQSASSNAAGSADLIYAQALGAPDRSNGSTDEYRLGPLDRITVNVYGQPNLGVEKAQVDASGYVSLPLVGAVQVAGRTPPALAQEIANKLGERYLQSPQVSVLVDEAVSQRVTVAGAVMESGVYTLRGPTTLIQAVSLAKGPDQKIANLRNVAIFRQIEGKRARAVFDLNAIQDGRAEDPPVFGGDMVVVSGSNSKSIWREFVGALPAVGVFAWF